MFSKKLLLVLLGTALTISMFAQQPIKGSVEYYESLRLAFQTKIDWVKSQPEEHQKALQSGWYHKMESDVQTFVSYKKLAQQATNGIYLPEGMQKNATAQNSEQGGALCSEAEPFCTQDVFGFPCGTELAVAEEGPDYGCLYSQPYPVWYYMKIADDGGGDIVMSLTAENDIDYVIWGPFDTITCDYNDLSEANIVDCSFSSTNEEEPEIGAGSNGNATYGYAPTTAVAGKYYIMLITNYFQQPQDFTLQKTGGDGFTDCSTLGTDLDVDYLVLQTDSCFPSDDNCITYSLSGSILIDPKYPKRITDSIMLYVDEQLQETINVNKPLKGLFEFNITDLPADGSLHTFKIAQHYSDGGNGFITKIYQAAGTPLEITDVSQTEIKLYPNPVKDNARLNLGKDYRQVQYVSVSNNLGKEVLSIRDIKQADVSISTKHLSSGVYFVNIVKRDKKTVLKLNVIK